jgi:aminoglycoside phosphotransferase (APT) family kinase protein
MDALAALRRRTEAGLATIADAVIDDFGLLGGSAGGGNSGITCVATLKGGALGDRIIVKVAPSGLPPVRNRDVLRQARLLRALASVPGVAVPSVLFESPGDPPDVPPFFAMSFVPGEIKEPVLETDRPSAAVVTARVESAARMLARLHGADARALGLADEPEYSLGDELDRWQRAFESVGDDLRAGHRAVAASLQETLPPPLPAVISHGDYRLGNMLCEGTAINAVIDWEIWSRTDPRMDVGWLLFMCDPSHPSSRGDVRGMPSAEDLREIYEAGRRTAAQELGWFRGLVAYKQAATCALLAKHDRRRGGDGAQFGRLVNPLLGTARTVLANDGDQTLSRSSRPASRSSVS